MSFPVSGTCIPMRTSAGAAISVTAMSCRCSSPTASGIRDMGSDLDSVLQARNLVAAHRLTGPRMVVSGPMLDGPRVTFAASIAIATQDDGRKAVRLLKSKGVDFIKIQSGVPRDAYPAIADEAKKQGLP